MPMPTPPTIPMLLFNLSVCLYIYLSAICLFIYIYLNKTNANANAADDANVATDLLREDGETTMGVDFHTCLDENFKLDCGGGEVKHPEKK